MAKRAQRGSLSPKSTRRTKKASGTSPANTGRSEPDGRKKLPTQQLDPGLKQPIPASRQSAIPAPPEPGSRDQERGNSLQTKKRTPQPITSVQPGPTGEPTQRLGTGKRIRTPPPVPDYPQETSVDVEQTQQGRFAPPRDRLQSSVQSDSAGGAIQRLGTGKRIRTPPPSVSALADGAGAPTQSLEMEGEIGAAQFGEFGFGGAEPQQGPLGRALGALRAGPVQKLQEKAAQFKHVQEFLQNPAPFSELRRKELDTSSTPEEIESRKGEVRYQIQIMQSVLAVLTEELQELEQARPQVKADQASPTHS